MFPETLPKKLSAKFIKIRQFVLLASELRLGAISAENDVRPAPAAVDGETAVLGDAGLADTLGADEVGPSLAGRVLYGERANFKRLVLGCIEGK